MSGQSKLATVEDLRKRAEEYERAELFRKIAIALISRNGAMNTLMVEGMAEHILIASQNFATKKIEAKTKGTEDEEEVKASEASSEAS